MEGSPDLSGEVLALTAQLAAQPSVNGSAGEAAKGRWLAQWLREHCALAPGFELHELPVSSSPHQPCNVLAFIPAPKAQGPAEPGDCLLLLGHYDTVGLEPYGEAAQQALDPAALSALFSQSPDPQLRAQAQSPDWRFGRGQLDMQGGVAAALLAFRSFAQQAAGTGDGRLSCGLALLLCPDEERDSEGVKAALGPLAQLATRHRLRWRGLLNVDYSNPGALTERRGRSRRSPQISQDGLDLRGILYSGTIGKLLLGVSVFGLPSHAAEPFAGLNSAALVAAIAARLEQQRSLLQGLAGQLLPAPTLLELRSRRSAYDVMTVQCSELYLNIFHHGAGLTRLWRRIEHAVASACRDYLRELRAQERGWRRRAQDPAALARWQIELLGYARLQQQALSAGWDAGAQSSRPAQDEDPREWALARIRSMEAALPRGRARVVLSLLPPFYPAQRPDAQQQRRWRAFAGRHALRWQPLYPFISDMSYFSFPPAGSPEAAELELLAAEAPLAFDPAQLEAQRACAMPLLNLGPIGLGAHSAFERVYLPYLEKLPALLIQTLRDLAG
ncbi:M20/M25/M40 family metallo-hydrolase [bacterium]|nr:M20/M25/M40 family metallo-hydrolase [bacterium]